MQLCRFVETVMCRTVPHVPAAAVIHPTDEPKPAAYQLPLDGTVSAAAAAAHVGNVAMDMQQHHHTATCKKGGYLGTDFSCRVAMPRPLVPVTSVLTKTGTFLVKCTNSAIAPYMQSLQMAHPTNMALYITSEVSTWWRQWHIWAWGKVTGTSAASPPKTPSAHMAGAEAAEYCLKYSTKPDAVNLSASVAEMACKILDKAHTRTAGERRPGHDIYDMFFIWVCFVVAAVLFDFSIALMMYNSCAGASTSTSPQQHAVGLSIIRQALNSVHGSVTYPSTMVAMLLLGYGDHQSC